MFETKASFRRKDTQIEAVDCVADKVIRLNGTEFDRFANNLTRDWDFIRDNPIDTVVDADGRFHCLLVVGDGRRDGILVNPEGSSYARYSAFLPGAAELLDNERYPALAELNQRLKTAADFIVELGFVGNPTNKYAIEISVVGNEYGLRLEDGSQLLDTLVAMVEARPEIESVRLGAEKILVEMKPDVLEAELLHRDMDDDAPFEVFITGTKVGPDGKPIGDWLPMPANAKAFSALLERVSTQGTGYNVFHITEFRSRHPDICGCLDTGDLLNELNMAASYLMDLEDFEWNKLHAVIAGGLGQDYVPRNAAALINLLDADNFDAVDLINANTPEQLGRYWDEEKPKRFSHEEYGRFVQQAEHGSFTKWGYIHFRHKEISLGFEGVVPEQYRISEAALKSFRAHESEHGKTSVLEQIREARKNPAPPSSKKDLEKGDTELER